MARVLRAGAAVLALALVAAPASSATKVTHKKAMWGPFVRDGIDQFPIYRDLGVGIVQHTLYWPTVSPERPAHISDPADAAYHWPADIDAAIAEGRRYGIQIMLQIQGSPPWANGGKPWNWAPAPKYYARFAAAAARRYPGVRLWMVWGEPCRANNFQPTNGQQQGRFGEPLRTTQKISPHRYARILDAAYGALHAVRNSNVVIGGNTFTQGGSISPLNWIKNLRLPNGRAPRMDMYGHNPISARRPDVRRPPLGMGAADMSDIDTLEHWLDRYLKPPNRHGRPLALFLSEFVLPTDHFSAEINFYVTRKTQAQWTTDALRITRRDPRLYTLGWYELYDENPVYTHDQSRYGLLDSRGKRKPAYYAFRRG